MKHLTQAEARNLCERQEHPIEVVCRRVPLAIRKLTAEEKAALGPHQTSTAFVAVIDLDARTSTQGDVRLIPYDDFIKRGIPDLRQRRTAGSDIAAITQELVDQLDAGEITHWFMPSDGGLRAIFLPCSWGQFHLDPPAHSQGHKGWDVRHSSEFNGKSSFVLLTDEESVFYDPDFDIGRYSPWQAPPPHLRTQPSAAPAR
jgi:hypothetical protein